MFLCFRVELDVGRDRCRTNAAALSTPDAEAGATTTDLAVTRQLSADHVSAETLCTAGTSDAAAIRSANGWHAERS